MCVSCVGQIQDLDSSIESLLEVFPQYHGETPACIEGAVNVLHVMLMTSPLNEEVGAPRASCRGVRVRACVSAFACLERFVFSPRGELSYTLPSVMFVPIRSRPLGSGRRSCMCCLLACLSRPYTNAQRRTSAGRKSDSAEPKTGTRHDPLWEKAYVIAGCVMDPAFFLLPIQSGSFQSSPIRSDLVLSDPPRRGPVVDVQLT